MNKTEKITLIGVVIGFMAWQFPVSESGFLGNESSTGAVTIYSSGADNSIPSSNVNINNQNVIATNGSVAIVNSDIINAQKPNIRNNSERITKELLAATDNKFEELQLKLDDFMHDLNNDLDEKFKTKNPPK